MLKYSEMIKVGERVTIFTQEEYEIMIYELTEKDPMSYDMMCEIAYRILKPKVKSWCFNHSALKGRQFEDDIIQEILLRLMKYCVTHFLRRESNNFEINHNPEEFRRWVIRVGKNYMLSFGDAQKNDDQKTRKIIERITSKKESLEMLDVHIIKTLPAFRLAFKSKKKIYIVVTWLTLSTLMIYFDITKIRATHLIEAEFSDKPLDNMWMVTKLLMSKIQWLSVTKEEIDHIESRLREPFRDDQSAGSIIYSEYFGEKGKKGGREVISDWVYRMNSWISTQINYESLNDC